MKIKRFFASDIRQALRQVRKTLGADAVILSNKTVEGGIELVAAIDYDESAYSQVAAPASSRAESRPRSVSNLQSQRQSPCSQPTSKTPTQARGAQFETLEDGQPSGHEQPAHPAPGIEWSQDPVLVEMRKEMKAMRRMMENELSGLSWREMGEHRPVAQELYRRLMGMGISPDICKQLVGRVADAQTDEQAWEKALYLLAGGIATVGDNLLEQGGVIALIGPTGVGKTTTVAKLAARFALKHGHRQVALISTDNYRIGAQEQLNTYAKILNVPVRTAGTPDELAVALNAFIGKKLVLIDTAGMSQRDVDLSEKLSVLSLSGKEVRSFLTLSAATEQASLDQTIRAFGAAQPEACILTKVDEAASLGGALSALIHNKLPLAFITDGQKVPEDIHLARAQTLVDKAAAFSDGGGVDYNDEYLALALGGARANAHG